MKQEKLLYALGNIREQYIEEMLNVPVSKYKHSTKKIWLIAAVIAAMVFLLGCAMAYALSVQDMAFGQIKQEFYDGSSQERTLISLQGIKGTPGYQATKEWHDWLETYDKDGAVWNTHEAFGADFGDDYYAYSIYSQEMKDKLDEICDKYDLELLGKMYVDPDLEAGCKALQIPGIFRSEVQVEADFESISYYANGSFDLEGHARLPGYDSHIVSFSCHRKDAFTELYASIGPEGTYEEWTYTTSHGVDVLMIIETGSVRGHAFMMVDNGAYMYYFGIYEFEDMPLPDKAELEAYAEAVDFTVQPQRVSRQELEKTEKRIEEADAAFADDHSNMAHFFSELGYENRIKFQLEYAVNPELLGFAVLDLDGNGSEDLLVGENGYIRAVYTTKDGGSQHMMPVSVMYTNAINFGNDKGIGEYGGWSYIYLCANNGLAYVYDLEGAGEAYHFASVKNGELIWADRIVYDPVGHADSPWMRYDEDHRSHPITKEEFEQTRDSYTRVSLDMYPISDYPLTDDSPSGIGKPPETYDGFDDLVASRIEYAQDYARDRSDWGYQLTDLDGDGQQELIWQEGSWIGVFTMKDGQVKQLVSGLDVQLCEGNILAVSRSYLDGNRTYCYYTIANGDAVLVNYLRYDADRDPENPWFFSYDLTGQDLTLEPISELEAKSIIASYDSLGIDMKPISDYPS